MNVLNRIVLEVKIGEEEMVLSFRPSCPAEVINQALLQMNQYMNQVIADAAKKKEESEKIESLPVEENEQEKNDCIS